MNMAALEIEGRIAQKLAKQSGQGAKGAWSKQDFILEYQDGNFPSQICFTAFGNDKVADLDKYQVGDKIKVSFNLRAREYNGRWYNDVRTWRIAPADQPVQPQDGHPAPGRNNGQPVPAQPQQAPAPTLDDMPAGDSGEDLPF